MSKNSTRYVTRTVPVIASFAALAIAAACSKGGGSERVNTRGPVDTKSETSTILTDAFKGMYKSTDEKNMELARRIEGASATAVVSSQLSAEGKKMFDVNVRVLVGEENKNQPALIVDATGTIIAGEKADVSDAGDSAVVAPATTAVPIAPSAEKVAGKEAVPVKRVKRASLQFTGETSEEAAKRFFIYGVCADTDCSRLSIMLKELAQIDATGGKLTSKNRHTAFVFKRSAGASVETPMTLIWSGNVDPKKLDSGTKQTFEAAAEARTKQGLPIATKASAPVQTPAADAGAPSAGDGQVQPPPPATDATSGATSGASGPASNAVESANAEIDAAAPASAATVQDAK